MNWQELINSFEDPYHLSRKETQIVKYLSKHLEVLEDLDVNLLEKFQKILENERDKMKHKLFHPIKQQLLQNVIWDLEILITNKLHREYVRTHPENNQNHNRNIIHPHRHSNLLNIHSHHIHQWNGLQEGLNQRREAVRNFINNRWNLTIHHRSNNSDNDNDNHRREYYYYRHHYRR